MSQRSRGISLPELSILIGPDPEGPETKYGAAAEAGRREVDAMQAIQAKPLDINKQRDLVHAFADPLERIKDGPVTLKPHEAGAILRRCRYERQTRDLKPAGKAHVEVLTDMMRRKQWRSRDQLDFARLSGALILVNGHHRLTAQEKAGEDIEWTIVVHPCVSEDDVARLYYTFDTNLRGRSNETILSAMDAAEKFGLSKTVTEALFRAAPLLSTNFDFARNARDPVASRVIDRRLEVMRGFAKEAQLWEAATKKAPVRVRQRLLTQGAFSVALMAFRHRPYEADQFYRGLAENDGLAKGDPRNTYLIALLTNSPGGTLSYTARQASVAWNAFMRGKSLSIIKIVEANTFRIAGTPVGR